MEDDGGGSMKEAAELLGTSESREQTYAVRIEEQNDQYLMALLLPGLLFLILPFFLNCCCFYVSLRVGYVD